MAAQSSRTRIDCKNEKGGTPRSKRNWRSLFLNRLGDSSNVANAARHAGISTSRAYQVRRKDSEFAQQWLAALQEGYAHLEMEVLRRLRDGDFQTEDGSKYDFANAIRLLAAHRDNAVKASTSDNDISAAEVRASIDQKVEAIRAQVHRERQKKRLRTLDTSK